MSQVPSVDVSALCADRAKQIMAERLAESSHAPAVAPPVVETLQNKGNPSGNLPAGEVSFLSGLLGESEDLEPTELLKPRQDEGAVKEWIADQIAQGLQTLHVDTTKFGYEAIQSIEDAVWAGLLAGKIGDGTISTATKLAIMDTLTQMVQAKTPLPTVTDMPVQPIDSNAGANPMVPAPATAIAGPPPDDMPITHERQMPSNIFSQLAEREGFTPAPSEISTKVEKPLSNGGVGEPTETPNPTPKKPAEKLTDLHKTAIKMWQAAKGKDWKSALKTAWETGKYEAVDELTANVLAQVKAITGGDLGGLSLDAPAESRNTPPVRTPGANRHVPGSSKKVEARTVQPRRQIQVDPEVQLILREGMDAGCRSIRKGGL